MQPNPWMDVLAYIVDHPISFAGFAAVTYTLFAKGLGAATWTMALFTAGVIAVSSLGGATFVGGVLTGVVANEVTHFFRRRSSGA